MSYILTCGCKSEHGGFPSEWDGETRECEPCVNYGSLCEKHYWDYEARPAQTAPQYKDLSDEEIYKKWNEANVNSNHTTPMRKQKIDFARAIIKASRGEE